MGRWEKLVDDICRAPVPTEASTRDVCALLEGAGWVLIRRGGRNYLIFESPTGAQLNVPMVQGRRVKRTYLKRACETLGLDEPPNGER